MAVSKEVQAFVDELKKQFTSIGDSVDSLVTSQAGVAGDVAKLKGIIDKLQNNPGPISTEDQALLTEGVAVATALATKTAGVSAALKTLDDATDPDEVPELPVS
jgi:hypothetical protein